MSPDQNLELSDLLTRVQAICCDERSKRAVASEYNIFEVVGMASREATHSAFLAHLLNPQATHDQGSLFLRLFLDVIGISAHASDQAVVTTEHHIGSISENYEDGGRIDIVISDPTQGLDIYIENKIYASDQHRQLSRYHRYRPTAHLVYLTLQGSEASDDSRGDYPITAYTCISYKDHIARWLDKCLGKVAGVPALREILQQYIMLVESLTGNHRENKMHRSIMKEVLQTKESQEATFAILSSRELIRKEFVRTQMMPIFEECAKAVGLDFEPDDKDFGNAKYWGWSYSNKVKPWQHVKVRFEFQSYYSGLIYGVNWRNGIQPVGQTARWAAVVPVGGASSAMWPYYHQMTKYSAWDDGFLQTMCEDSSREKLRNEIVVKLQHMLEVANAMEGVLA